MKAPAASSLSLAACSLKLAAWGLLLSTKNLRACSSEGSRRTPSLKLVACGLELVGCGPAPVSKRWLAMLGTSGAMLVFTICNVWNGLVPTCPAAQTLVILFRCRTCFVFSYYTGGIRPEGRRLPVYFSC